MSYLATIPFILLLALAGRDGAAAPRIGEAEVRETGNGTPCFTISEREERRGTPDFRAVTVYDPSSKPPVRMWAMAMPHGRSFPVLFSMCIPYAGRVQALPQTEAALLKTGRVYEVVIDARVPNSPASPSGYSARFCLARQRNGSVIVHHIGPDAHEGRHLYGCLPGD